MSLIIINHHPNGVSVEVANVYTMGTVTFDDVADKEMVRALRKLAEESGKTPVVEVLNGVESFTYTFA